MLPATVRAAVGSAHMGVMEPSKTPRSPYLPAALDAARFVLGYHVLPGGSVPGQTTAAVIELWALSDDAGREHIRKGWPMLAYALRIFDEDGMDGLHKMLEFTEDSDDTEIPGEEYTTFTAEELEHAAAALWNSSKPVQYGRRPKWAEVVNDPDWAHGVASTRKDAKTVAMSLAAEE